MHHIELVVSPPLIQLTGSSGILSDNLINELNLGGRQVNMLGNSRQSKLHSKWKAPMSIAAGYSSLYTSCLLSILYS